MNKRIEEISDTQLKEFSKKTSVFMNDLIDNVFEGDAAHAEYCVLHILLTMIEEQYGTGKLEVWIKDWSIATTNKEE